MMIHATIVNDQTYLLLGDVSYDHLIIMPFVLLRRIHSSIP